MINMFRIKEETGLEEEEAINNNNKRQLTARTQALQVGPTKTTNGQPWMARSKKKGKRK